MMILIIANYTVSLETRAGRQSLRPKLMLIVSSEKHLVKEPCAIRSRVDTKHAFLKNSFNKTSKSSGNIMKMYLQLLK